MLLSQIFSSTPISYKSIDIYLGDLTTLRVICYHCANQLLCVILITPLKFIVSNFPSHADISTTNGHLTSIFLLLTRCKIRHITISVSFVLNIDKVYVTLCTNSDEYTHQVSTTNTANLGGFCLTGLFFWISLRIKLGHLKVGLTKKVSGDCWYEIFQTSNVDAQNETISWLLITCRTVRQVIRGHSDVTR